MEAPSSPPLFIYLESQSFPEKLNHGGKGAHLALPIPPVISLATSSTPQLLIPLHRNRACIHNDVNKHLSHRHLLEPSWGHRSMFCYPSQANKANSICFHRTLITPSSAYLFPSVESPLISTQKRNQARRHQRMKVQTHL